MALRLTSTGHLHQSERQFQRAVVEFARLHGWRCFHVNDARRIYKEVGGEGYPDWAFARVRPRYEYVLAELKSVGKTPTPEQWLWGEMIRGAGGRWYWWTPTDWPTIEEVLGGPLPGGAGRGPAAHGAR